MIAWLSAATSPTSAWACCAVIWAANSSEVSCSASTAARAARRQCSMTGLPCGVASVSVDAGRAVDAAMVWSMTRASSPAAGYRESAVPTERKGLG